MFKIDDIVYDSKDRVGVIVNKNNDNTVFRVQYDPDTIEPMGIGDIWGHQTLNDITKESKQKVIDSICGPLRVDLRTPSEKPPEALGTKFNQGKAMLHLVPEEAIIGAAEGFMYGAGKYGAFNYKKGLTYTDLTDSLRRHTLALLMGEDIDEESGLHHTKLILANASMLEWMRCNRPDMDNRWKKEE